MKTIYKYGRPFSEIKDLDFEKRIVQAYYANFENVDTDGDIISESAYKKSIKDRGPRSEKPRIKHLFNHWDAAGNLIEMGQDKKGAYFTSKLGRHTVGNDTLMMYEDGIITEHSHGFEVVKTSNTQIDEKDVRIIEEAVLWEVTSLDKWGANMHTPVMKSLEDKKYWQKRIEAIEMALKKGKYTDETFEILEIQLKQIQQLLISEPGVQSTPPEPGKTTHLLTNINLKTKKKWNTNSNLSNSLKGISLTKII